MASSVWVAFIALWWMGAGAYGRECVMCEWMVYPDHERGDEFCVDSPNVTLHRVDCAFILKTTGQDPNTTFCAIYEQKKFMGNGQYLERYFLRACGSKCESEGVFYKVDEHGNDYTLHCCEGDFCNSTGALVSGLSVIAVSLFLSLFSPL